MTAARIRGSQRIRSNSENDLDPLEGFNAVIKTGMEGCTLTGTLTFYMVSLCGAS